MELSDDATPERLLLNSVNRLRGSGFILQHLLKTLKAFNMIEEGRRTHSGTIR